MSQFRTGSLEDEFSKSDARMGRSSVIAPAPPQQNIQARPGSLEADFAQADRQAAATRNVQAQREASEAKIRGAPMPPPAFEPAPIEQPEQPGFLTRAFQHGRKLMRAAPQPTGRMMSRAAGLQPARPQFEPPRQPPTIPFEQALQQARDEPADVVRTIVEHSPFIGGFAEGARVIQVGNSIRRLEAGTGTDEDQMNLARFAVEMEEADERTFLGGIAQLVAIMPAFMIEFVATSGLFTLGRKVGQKALVKASKAGLRKYLDKRITGAVLKTGAAAGGAGLGVALQTAGNPQLVFREFAQRRLPQYNLTVDEQGFIEQLVIEDDGEEFLDAFLNSYLSGMVELGSERTGGHTIKGMAWLAGRIPWLKGVSPKVGAALVKIAWINEWLGSGRSISKLRSVLNRVGYHGAAIEVSEEEFGKLARAGLGLEEYQVTKLDELLQQAAAFSIPGGIATALDRRGGGGGGAQPISEDALTTEQADQQQIEQREQAPDEQAVDIQFNAEAETRSVQGPKTTAVPDIQRGGAHPINLFKDRNRAEEWARSPGAWIDAMQAAVAEGRRRPVVEEVLDGGMFNVRFEKVDPKAPDQRTVTEPAAPGQQPVRAPGQQPQPSVTEEPPDASQTRPLRPPGQGPGPKTGPKGSQRPGKKRGGKSLGGVQQPATSEPPAEQEIRKELIDSLETKARKTKPFAAIPVPDLSTAEQQELVRRGMSFTTDRQGRPHMALSSQARADELREKVTKGRAEQETLTQAEAERLRALKKMGGKKRRALNVQDEFEQLRKKKQFRRTVKIPKQFRRKAVEDEILKQGAPIVEAAQVATQQLEAYDREHSSGLAESNPFSFQNEVPTEVKEYFEGDKIALSKFRGNVPGAEGQTIWDTLGSVQYFGLLEEHLSSGKTGKIRLLRRMLQTEEGAEFDPQLAFLLNIQEKLSDPGFTLKDQDAVDVADLDLGDTFEVHGEKYTIIFDEFGTKIAQDGIPINLEAFDEIPVDKGTLDKEGEEPGGPQAPDEEEAPPDEPKGPRKPRGGGGVGGGGRRRTQAPPDAKDEAPEPTGDQAQAPEEPEVTPDQDVLKKAGLTVTQQGKKWSVTGNTFIYRDILKSIEGARFDGRTKSWQYPADPTEQIAARIRDAGIREQPGPGQDNDAEVAQREAREREQRRPDARRTRKVYIANVDSSTADLLRKGEQFHIPEAVVNDQIEDVGKIAQAFDDKQPMFIVGSAPGMGKTFVLGGAIRELRRRGAKRFIYVTENQELIKQVRTNLKEYGLEGVEFVTYAGIRKEIPETQDTVVLLDEAHKAKNVGMQTGRKVATMVTNAQYTVYATATPFENVVQAEYLESSGVFNDVHVEIPRTNQRGRKVMVPFSGFPAWAWAHGARIYIPKNSKTPVVFWPKEHDATDAQIAANEWLQKKGVYAQRPMVLPPETVNSDLRAISADSKWVDIFAKVLDAYELAKGYASGGKEASDINMHGTNLQKRILEAAKVKEGIKRAKELIAEGKQVIIFVNHKKERDIGRYQLSAKYRQANGIKGKEAERLYTPEEIDGMMVAYERAVQQAAAAGEPKPGPSPFWKAIWHISRAMKDRDVHFVLPRVADEIMAAFPKDQVVEYTGDVPDAKAQGNLAKWKHGKAKLIVATMDKGGTGLSYHDTTGKMPLRHQVNINLPWSGTQVEQVAGRLARLGTAKPVSLEWIFADNIPFERQLSRRVGTRVESMMAAVQGRRADMGARIKEFDFEEEGVPAKGDTVDVTVTEEEPGEPKYKIVDQTPRQMESRGWFSFVAEHDTLRSAEENIDNLKDEFEGHEFAISRNKHDRRGTMYVGMHKPPKDGGEAAPEQAGPLTGQQQGFVEEAAGETTGAQQDLIKQTEEARIRTKADAEAHAEPGAIDTVRDSTLKDSDYRAASPFIPDKYPVGSTIETAFVDGVGEAIAGRDAPLSIDIEELASSKYTPAQLRRAQREGFSAYRKQNPESPGGTQLDTSTASMFDEMEQKAKDRIKNRTLKGKGRHKGGTTLGGDLADIAVIAAARIAKAGVKTAKTIDRIVREVAKEVGRKLNDTQIAEAAQRAVALASRVTRRTKPSEILGAGKFNPLLKATGQRGEILVRDVGRHIDSFMRQKHGRRLNPNNPEHLARAKTQLVRELRWQKEQEESGHEFYGTKTDEAMAITEEVIPQLKDNPDLQYLFFAVLGPMSNNTKPEINWRNTAVAIVDYLKTGKLPLKNPTNGEIFGKHGHTIAQHMGLLNHILKEQGTLERAVSWLMSNQRGEELNRMRVASGVVGKAFFRGGADAQYPGFFIFGPKVGPFITDFIGHDHLTVDKWANRTWNRYFGRTTGPAAVNNDTGLADSALGKEKPLIQQLFAEAAAEVGDDVATAQARMWHYEKALYNDLGVPEARTQTGDFVDAAQALRGRSADEGGALHRSALQGKNRRARTAKSKSIFQDESGGIPIQNLEEGARVTGAFLKRNFTAPGDLPLRVFRQKVLKDAKIGATQTEIGFRISDVRRAAKKAYGQSIDENGKIVSGFENATFEQIDILNDYLHNEAHISELPDAMQRPMARMRRGIDRLSRQLINTGAVQGPLALTIEEHLGVYVTRTYAIFDMSGKKWAKTVREQMPDVLNKAIQQVRMAVTPPSREDMEDMKRSELGRLAAKLGIIAELPDRKKATLIDALANVEQYQIDQKVNGIIDKLLIRGEEAGTPVAIIKQSKLGAKDLGILQHRKDIPDWLRALWGEHKDPVLNYVRSIDRMSHLLANHEFLSAIRAEGMGEYFLEPHQGPITRDQNRKFIVQISADASKVMWPLNGVWTTPEIAKAFEDAVSKTEAPQWLRWYFKLNGIVKFNKTVGSMMTHVRNLIGNVGFAVASGHWRVDMGARAFGATFTRLSGWPSARQRAYFLKLQKLGIINESARAGELRAVMRDAAGSDLDVFTGSAAARKAKKILRAATLTYQAEDDIWKIYAFENEMARRRKALPDLSEEQLERQVAEIIRNTYPTYSLVPRGVQFLRRFPLVGTFVSFPYEVIRTSLHQIRLARKEWQDPRLRGIAAQRTVGMAIAATGTAAVAYGFKEMFGSDDEIEWALRRFVPYWSKNSQIADAGTDDKGNRRYIDLSYTDPHEYIKRPLIALLSGDDDETIVARVLESAMEAMRPFLSEEILAKKLIEVRANRKESGGRVYNPQDDPDKIALDWIAHVGDAITPGTINSMSRIWKGLEGQTILYGKEYHALTEAMATVTGVRMQKLDPRQAMSWKAQGFQRELRDSSRQFTSQLTKSGKVSESQIRSGFESMTKSRARLFEEMRKDVKAAGILGLSEDQITSVMRSAGVSAVNIGAIFEGDIPPMTVSKQLTTAVAGRIAALQPTPDQQEKASQEFERRLEIVDELVESQVE